MRTDGSLSDPESGYEFCVEHYYQAQGNWLTAQSRKK